MASSEDIVVDVGGDGIAVVTLNRPEKRNAVSFAMWRRLGDIFEDLGRRTDVRIVILTGAGGNFCAGADISEFADIRSTIEDAERYEAAGDRATRALRDLSKPTIAAIQGFGVGGGCGLALACDIRIGEASTRMGIPAARLGIVYGVLDTGLLLRQVGLANAKRVLFSGRYFPAEDCLAMRLLDVLSPDGAMRGARAWAGELATRAPLSQRGAKCVLEILAQGAEDARAPDVRDAIEAALKSADYREGGRAFIEKRPPAFVGH